MTLTPVYILHLMCPVYILHLIVLKMVWYDALTRVVIQTLLTSTLTLITSSLSGLGKGSYEVGHVERLHSAQTGVWGNLDGSSHANPKFNAYDVPAEPLSPDRGGSDRADPRGSYFNFDGPYASAGATGNTPRLINARPIGSARKQPRFSVTDLSGNFDGGSHNNPRLKSIRNGGGMLNSQMSPKAFPPSSASAGMGSTYASSHLGSEYGQYGSEYGAPPAQIHSRGSIANVADRLPAHTLNVGSFTEATGLTAPNSPQQDPVLFDHASGTLPQMDSTGQLRLSTFQLDPTDLGLAPLREVSGLPDHESSSDMGYLSINGVGPAYTSTNPDDEDEMDTKL